MRAKTMTAIWVTMIVAVIAPPDVWAAKQNAVPETPLTEAGRKLEAGYSGQLKALQEELTRAVPAMDEQKKSAYLKAREAEKAAEAEANAAQQRRGKAATAQALVNHAEGKWIGGADRGIAGAQAMLKKATTEAERNAAQKELVKWQENRAAGIEALKERQEALDTAKLEEPKLIQELDAAKEALAQAQANTLKAIKDLNLESFLSSDKLDAKLAKYVVLLEATPRGLAEFAQQGKAQETLVEKLLADTELMKQMVVADGARECKYGRAMEIYTAIQEASTKAGEGLLQRLAVGISLEHAVPVKQRNAESETDAPANVDPVKRYLHFEKAFLNNELDPGFKGLSAWDYRMVVNGEEPDHILAWGREMLRNYRPDHITTADQRWRYVEAVKTDVRYGSQDNKYDKPELQFFQNIIMNGGVCGRRAFFGRFILRGFGVPTTARPQPGHAALARWTPEGWAICLGGGWGAGWVQGRKKDLDFLAITQARATGETYLQVKRAQWMGDVVGEKRTFGFHDDDPAFWSGLALYRQRAIIEEAKAVALAAVGEDIGEANESKVKDIIEEIALTDEDKAIVVGKDGTITIPAASCSSPTKSTGKIIFMESTLGGKQLHYSRNGGPQDFVYTFDAPAAGKYALSARVVTTSWKQHLFVVANVAKEPIDIALPHTVGMWEKTEPVEVALVKGKNVLKFSREHEELKGVTIKDFTLTPVKE
ncbi:MAG: hypothetical protein O3B01_21590 [Planctomycetota bacterium]|nr:hypothetical protein [Planctomycetota bacterium]